MIKKTATTKIISRFLKLNTNFKNKFDKNVCQNSEPKFLLHQIITLTLLHRLEIVIKQPEKITLLIVQKKILNIFCN